MKQPLVRRTLASLTAIALGLTGVIAATQPAVAATTLVAHYPLTETTGTIAAEARLNRVAIAGMPVTNNALAPGATGGLLWAGPDRVAVRDRAVLFAGPGAGGVEERSVASALVTSRPRI